MEKGTNEQWQAFINKVGGNLAGTSFLEYLRDPTHYETLLEDIDKEVQK